MLIKMGDKDGGPIAFIAPYPAAAKAMKNTMVEMFTCAQTAECMALQLFFHC